MATVCVVGVVHVLDVRRQVIGATRMQAIVDSVVDSTTCANRSDMFFLHPGYCCLGALGAWPSAVNSCMPDR